MKLISTESGRVVQLVELDEIRPVRGFDLPALFHKVAMRYGFAKAPTDFGGFNQPSGAKFEHGRFSHPKVVGEIAIADLSLFNDGVIAACADTNLTDLLMDDLFGWAIESDLMRRPVTAKPRTYISNVVIEFNKLPIGIIDRTFKTSARFNAMLKSQYGWDHTTNVSRLAFATDSTIVPQYHAVNFIIERRANVPHSRNWFWSTAPFPLSNHLKLLEETELDLIKE